jgi:gamma-glutamylcyclotransferase (GGCT)/AIG2-like uncharacterized protein YtfP
MPHTATHSPPTNSRPSGPQDRLSVDPDALFVYGTLLFPDVLQALLGRRPDSRPATATGWRVATLPSRVYPGLVSGSGSVNGRLITDLTRAEWRILDTFEDDTYELRQITLLDGPDAWAYVYTSDDGQWLRSWDAERFLSEHLSHYVETCIAWRIQYHDKRWRT